jgi:hypothetical protein
MEPEGSLPHSQVPATCLYPEPAQSSPYSHIQITALLYVFSFTKPGMHRFSKNVGATLKFKAPKGCHEVIYVLKTHKYQAPPFRIQSLRGRGSRDFCTPA